MPVRNYKSMTNGTRGMSVLINDVITKATPEKSLVITLKKNGGRNNQGKITLRHRGGGAKRKYRVIDFKRFKDGVVGTVAAVDTFLGALLGISSMNYKKNEELEG